MQEVEEEYHFLGPGNSDRFRTPLWPFRRDPSHVPAPHVGASWEPVGNWGQAREPDSDSDPRREQPNGPSRTGFVAIAIAVAVAAVAAVKARLGEGLPAPMAAVRYWTDGL